jgi:hypothetical protein
MEDAHTDHHPYIANIIHYAGNEIAPVMLFKEGVGQRYEAGIKIPTKFVLDVPGSVEYAHPGSIPENPLKYGSQGSCDDDCREISVTGLEPVDGVFDEKRDYSGKKRGKDEGQNALREPASLPSYVGEDAPKFSKHINGAGKP